MTSLTTRLFFFGGGEGFFSFSFLNSIHYDLSFLLGLDLDVGGQGLPSYNSPIPEVLLKCLEAEEVYLWPLDPEILYHVELISQLHSIFFFFFLSTQLTL